MTIESSVLRIGNSCGIIIPSGILKSLSLSVKDRISISDSGGRIILQKIPDTQASPFSELDEWCAARGYSANDSLESSLKYIESIKAKRLNKEAPEW